jgi:spermidine/putrescine transport system permease protein
VLITLAALPLAFPALLYAIGLAISYRELGVGLSLAATIAGHVIIAFPFVVLVLSAAIARFRRPLLEAASDLGASPWTAFRTVALPLLFPAVVGATLLAMALSLDEFVIAFFTAGQDKTLPLVLYARLNQGLNPSLNAMGTVLFAVTTTLALFAARRMSRDV